MDILAELNPAQRQAAEAISGPVLILAGTGEANTLNQAKEYNGIARFCPRWFDKLTMSGVNGSQ
jgi:hypothetical protein